VNWAPVWLAAKTTGYGLLLGAWGRAGQEAGVPQHTTFPIVCLPDMHFYALFAFAFAPEMCFFLHMSMAFLWVTFYLHLIKDQMRCAAMYAALNTMPPDGKACVCVGVCMFVCHKCDIYDAGRYVARGQRLTVASVFCNGKMLLEVYIFPEFPHCWEKLSL